MIVLITTRGHGYTLGSINKGTFGVPTPPFRRTTYDRMFRRFRAPRATYVFADLERLSPFELSLAADLYRALTAAGFRCLNDPARAMSRVELLVALEAAGINPFGAYRADTAPRPKRFPVFLRSEQDHVQAADTLYPDQDTLDAALVRLRAAGTPLRGLLVVEQAAEPYAEGRWAKWGTWRVGDHMSVDHIAVDDTWLVKYGDHAKVTGAIAEDEHDAVLSNRFAEPVRRAFDIGGIAFGRADHGSFGGRPVVYEINTNAYLGRYSNHKNPLRAEAHRVARTRFAEALEAIDSEGGGSVALPATPLRRPLAWWQIGFVGPKRP
ncbi:hypothetical protein [Prosthecomicrobium pneumaticum]|uniref:ATP-grasp domain-containing protein n=1 Tax=Prosthecomicrobium pneumaticum TaxID=81895 RepID=A0A7W9FJ56_9HYPH|nr:hypothetical protein [Prosthecomicrobium pneumaticum]MBB5751226.1 hypothetical protein [Prosthecomicrobium pneumaticum]